MNSSIRSFFAISCALLEACGAAPASDTRGDSAAVAAFAVTTGSATTKDWTRFGWDAGRSSAVTDATGITAANVASLRRTQVQLDGTVDASAIYLKGVRANGAAHDVI